MAATSSVMMPFLSTALSSATMAFFAMKSVSFMDPRSSCPSTFLPPALAGRFAEDGLGFRAAPPGAEGTGLALQLVLESMKLTLDLFDGDVERAGGGLLLGVHHEDRGAGRVQDQLRRILAVLLGREDHLRADYAVEVVPEMLDLRQGVLLQHVAHVHVPAGHGNLHRRLLAPRRTDRRRGETSRGKPDSKGCIDRRSTDMLDGL